MINKANRHYIIQISIDEYLLITVFSPGIAAAISKHASPSCCIEKEVILLAAKATIDRRHNSIFVERYMSDNFWYTLECHLYSWSFVNFYFELKDELGPYYVHVQKLFSCKCSCIWVALAVLDFLSRVDSIIIEKPGEPTDSFCKARSLSSHSKNNRAGGGNENRPSSCKICSFLSKKICVHRILENETQILKYNLLTIFI